MNVKRIKICTAVCFVIVCVIILKQFWGQKFSSVEDLQEYMKGFGAAAPLILVLFQAFQVVVPVLPGYLGCAAGAVAFGSMTGFWCNYIGISAGSITAYYLARRYGVEIVLAMFPQNSMKNGEDVWKKAGRMRAFCLLQRCSRCSRMIFYVILTTDEICREYRANRSRKAAYFLMRLCASYYTERSVFSTASIPLRSAKDEQQEVYLDHHPWKALVHTGIQYPVRNAWHAVKTD